MARRRHDHDDAAATPVGDHEPRRVLGAQERPGEIHGELAIPALERHLEHAQAAEDPGVVDEHVDAAEALAGARDHRRHLRFVGDVTGDAERLAAAALDRFGALLGVLGDLIDAHDRGPLVGQPLGDAAADVGAGPGDDRDLPRELHRRARGQDFRACSCR